MFHSFRYKTGYIHLSYTDGKFIVRVQVDQYAYAVQVKSVLSAKRMITQRLKTNRAMGAQIARECLK